MEHTKEYHMKVLDELCQCCGYLNLTQKQKKARTYPKLVSERAADVLTIFNLCLTNMKDTQSLFVIHVLAKYVVLRRSVWVSFNQPGKTVKMQVIFGVAFLFVMSVNAVHARIVKSYPK